jgi:hypothetical protein
MNEDILKRLQAVPSGLGWVARCPAHDDKYPSLIIREEDGGLLKMICLSGCPWAKVQEALSKPVESA